MAETEKPQFVAVETHNVVKDFERRVNDKLAEGYVLVASGQSMVRLQTEQVKVQYWAHMTLSA